MNILLLGANGQLGTDLFRVSEQLLPHATLIPLTRTHLDLAEIDQIKKRLSSYTPDLLINATAYNRVDDAEEESDKAYRMNAYAVEQMAAYCQECGIAFLHFSTDFVFNGKKGTPYTEADLPMPLSVYGASKALGEALAFRACEKTLVVRVASLYGVAGSSGKKGNFVEAILRRAKEEKKVQVVSDITMSPTSTNDVAQTICSLLQQEMPPAGIYHLVNSGQATWYEFAREILHQTKMNADLIPVQHDTLPMKAARPLYSVLDNRKITSLLGEEPPSWQEALHHYLAAKGYLS